MKRLSKFLLLTLALVMLAGCGSDSIKNVNTSTTMGQELADLEVAREKGIISEKEFERAKDDILDKYDD